MRFLSSYSILILCILFLLSNGCEEENEKTEIHRASYTSQLVKAVPELLPRNKKIGSPEEQAKVFETYHMLKKSINQDPTNYRRRLQLAQLFMLEARATGEHGHYYPAALNVLDAILAEKPEADVIFGAKSLKASVMLSLHEFKQAKRLAKEAIAINGYNALIYGSLVDAEVELGNYESAIAMADKMVSIRPDIRSYSRVSYLREIHGDMDGAIEAMKMAVKAGYPGFEETAWASLILGELLEKEGKMDAAKEVFEGILVERENYPFAIDALARIAMKRKDYDQAEILLKKACAIIPEVGFYERLAALYLETGRGKEGEKLKVDILEMLADDEAKGHKMGMEYARVYMELFGDYKKALEYAQKEYEYRPKNKDVNQLLAAIYLKLEDYSAASTYLNSASKTASTDPELVTMQALMSYRNGNEEVGLKKLQEHIKKNPYQNHIFIEAAKELIGA